MFLHVVQDEKFITETVDLFNDCDAGNHIFVRITANTSDETKHIDKANIKKIVFKSPEYASLLACLNQYTAIIIHGFFSAYHIDLANKAPSNATLVWIFWGGELLQIPRYRRHMLLPFTKGLYCKNQVIPWLQRNWHKYTAILSNRRTGYNYSRKKRTEYSSSGTFEQAVKRVDYIIPVLEEDFHLLKRLISCKAEMLDWNYPVPKLPAGLENRKAEGGNVLIGNSAHYTNNHWEVFRRLRQVKGFHGKVIVPLSYGDQLYRRDIIRIGSAMFKDRFDPLTEFMSYASYVDRLCSCPTAIFNTRRQQAMGNILILLHLGARIFLREDNPAYSYLRSNGAAIFSMQKDFPKRSEDFGSLTSKQVEANRHTLRRLADRCVIEAKTCALVKKLKTEPAHNILI